MRRAKFIFSHLVLLVLLMLGAANPVVAKPLSNAWAIAPAPAHSIARPQVTTLIAQAQTQGAVRVIVGVRVNHQPEGRLRNAQAIRAQRAAIAQAQTALVNQVSNQDARVIRQFAFMPYLAMQVNATALAALAANPNVTHIVPDQLRAPSLSTSVPLIGAPAAWGYGYTGAGQTVAVLDSGIAKSHPFLTGKVIAEACFSTNNPTDTATSLCPGGVTQSTDPDSGLNCTVVGICVHGTHVAGIVAGKDDGTIGFSGVAKDANLIAIQVYSYFASCNCIMAYDSDILAAMEYVQTLSSTYNIAAINLSLGGIPPYATQAECDADYPNYVSAIANLNSLGIATVIAAGNGGSATGIESPGCVSGAISVGSTQDGSFGTIVDQVSSFSDSASFLSLLAPGQYITSSGLGTSFITMQGTSMATPHVAGAWAVLKSAKPSASVTQVLNVLTDTGKPILDSRNGITKPRIQLGRATWVLAEVKIILPHILLNNPP